MADKYDPSEAETPPLPEGDAFVKDPADARSIRNRAKDAKSGVDAELAGDEAPAKKGRKRPLIVASAAVAALALVAGGIFVGDRVSSTNAYNQAVEDYNGIAADHEETLALVSKATTEWPEKVAEHQTLLKELATAAKAPEALVSKKSNAPVVELSEEISSKKAADYGTIPEAPSSDPVDTLTAREGLGTTRTDVAQVKSSLAELVSDDALTVYATEIAPVIEAPKKEREAAVEAVSAVVEEALSNEAAWTKAHPKGDAKAFAKAADALTAAHEAHGDDADPAAIVAAHAEYVSSALALKKAHDAKIAQEKKAAAEKAAAEAAAAQAQAEADAAAAAAAAAQVWVDPGPAYDPGYSGGNDYVAPPAGGGGGYNPPAPPVDSGGGGGGYNPPPPPPPAGGGGGGGNIGGNNPGGGGSGCWAASCNN